MPERLDGIEALRQLPLRDIILPKGEAIEMLTASTLEAIEDNIAFIIEAQRSQGNDRFSPYFNVF